MKHLKKNTRNYLMDYKMKISTLKRNPTSQSGKNSWTTSTLHSWTNSKCGAVFSSFTAHYTFRSWT